MNDERIEELILKISTELAVLNSQTKSVLDTLSRHENRLNELERVKTGFSKDKLIEWLVKGLLIALMVIASSAGVTGVVKGLFGM